MEHGPHGPHHGSLQNWNRNTPPGWNPYDSNHYPYRKYKQLVDLWLRSTDITTSASVGPLIAGRLQGAALQVALKNTHQRPELIDGRPTDSTIETDYTLKQYIGAQALALPHKVILGITYSAGYELLLLTLDAEYGVHPQEQITVSLDTFFN